MSQQPNADQLSQLKRLTTVVADSGDFAAIRQYQPQDATTNPSLILKAIQQPEYLSLADDALRYAAENAAQYANGQDRTALAADKLAVLFGMQLLQQVPGYVSTEVDARLSFNSMATIEKAHQLLDMYKAGGADTSRVLIKIAATWEGIQAARVLEQQGINCNLTLIFSFAQARACAEAKAFLISPFVGRILDWYKLHQPQQDFSAAQDPGVQFVRRVYQYFKQHAYPTIVMGASFRNTSQIIELAGCDRLTISPTLLQQLAQTHDPVERKLHFDGVTEAAPAALTEAAPAALTEAAFRWQMLEDQMASDKLQEGIRLFAADQVKLEQLLRAL